MIGLYPRLSSTIALFLCASVTIPTNIAILYYLRLAKKQCDQMTKVVKGKLHFTQQQFYHSRLRELMIFMMRSQLVAQEVFSVPWM